MKKKDQKCGVLYIKRIPINLKSQFKAHCATRNRTMSEVIIKTMKEKIRE